MVAVTPYASEEILDLASVILPSAVFAETSGTWVNVEGVWQSCAGAARPAGEARPAWKILRVLGNLLEAWPGSTTGVPRTCASNCSVNWLPMRAESRVSHRSGRDDSPRWT